MQEVALRLRAEVAEAAVTLRREAARFGREPPPHPGKGDKLREDKGKDKE